MSDKQPPVHPSEIADLEWQPDPEELEEARQELEALTPIDMLLMKKEIDGLREGATIPEAGAIIFGEFVGSASGAAAHVTVRAATPEAAWDLYVRAAIYGRRYNMRPRKEYQPSQLAAQPPAPAAKTPEAGKTAPKVAPKVAPKAAPKASATKTAAQVPGSKLYPHTDIPHDGYFDASQIIATANKTKDKDGNEVIKTYLKVEGSGKFPKFPVTIWPEVLEEAGWDADTMVAGWDEYFPLDVSNYVALFVKNDAGNPAKVIALVEKVE